jgi:hypothetical protein
MSRGKYDKLSRRDHWPLQTAGLSAHPRVALINLKGPFLWIAKNFEVSAYHGKASGTS